MSENMMQRNLTRTTIDGFLRLSQIIGKKADPKRNIPAVPPIIPISKTSFLNGVKAGKYPKPVRLAERTLVWRVADIRELIERF
jgi:prophage regulatory protein